MTQESWQVRAWAPGRVEIAGNHTDHQGGRVVSAAVEQGVTMQLRARTSGDLTAHIESEGYEPFSIDLSKLKPVSSERNTSAALVRGVVAGLADKGLPIAGFDAFVTSTLPDGGGMSSSAAFELALAHGLVALFGPLPDGRTLSHAEYVNIAVGAEREYFDKPCGLQDQTAIEYGGICDMDFSNLMLPTVDRIDFSFEDQGYCICLVDTLTDHSKFTGDFNQLVEDMKTVAAYFGEDVLERVPPETFAENLARIRSSLGDITALRAWHYYYEIMLVRARAKALRESDMATFLSATRESGMSSAEYLQNVAVPGSTDQPAMIAMAAVRLALGGRGAARIHGGGFGGTIQAYVPIEEAETFVSRIESLLGPGVCNFVTISDRGANAQLLV